jgi:Flp pilus assembly protein TadG
MTRPRPNRLNSRSGWTTLEALWVVPILLIVVVALVEFAMVIAAEQKVAEASGLACRTAAVGRSDDDAREAVKAVLGKRQYDEAKIKIDRRHDDHLGDVVDVRVDLPVKAAAPCVLRSCGLKLCDDMLIGRTVMKAE